MRWNGLRSTLVGIALAATAALSVPQQVSAQQDPQRHIEVDTRERMLYLVEGRDTVLTAQVAVGKGYSELLGRDFSTPKGTRTVLGKERNPMWVPPDWHYREKAAARGLEVRYLTRSDTVALSDGSSLYVRGDDVRRRLFSGQETAIEQGHEIIFDGAIFVPPIGTNQRRIPDVLGTHKLDLGDGYYIHGTYETDSLGDYASHGCIRVSNDIAGRLYGLVPRGTRVVIN